MAVTTAQADRARRDSSAPLDWWVAILVSLIAAAVAFVWMLNSQLLRLYSLTAPSWDLGQSQQLLWSLANGHGWTSSYEFGHNFLGIHLELILVPIAAVEHVWPSPVVPLVFAAAGLAATAPAAFLMLRAMLPESAAATWLALALAAPMPFWVATQEAAADQFHPENLALALAMLAAWKGLRARPRLLWTFTLLALSCKEDQTYTAFVIGLLVWRHGSPAMRRHGLAVMIVAAAWLVIGAGLVETLMRGGGNSPEVVYYWWVLNPETNFFLRAISRPDPWLVLAGLLVSTLGLPLLAPRWLLLAVPPLAASLLSSHDPQERLHQHYALLLLFPLVLAAGFGARRLLNDWRVTRLPAPALLAGAAPALVLGFTAGLLPPAMGADQWLYTRPPASARLLAATRVIPPGAPVYADDGSAVWLANRTDIQQILTRLAPDRYVVIDRQDWAHRNDLVPGRADEIALMPATGRRLLVDDGRFQVWGPAG